MGDWSMAMTLSNCSMPSMRRCRPGRSGLRFSLPAMALRMISFTSVLLPDPETPVTHVKAPTGIRTSMSRRLFSRAPSTDSQPCGSRRVAGTGIVRAPDRYAPVTDPGSASTSAAVPAATTRPPCSPAPGPMSMRWSDARIMSSSCSTTSTVLPISRRRSRVPMSLRLSRWCRPMDGSSRMYSTPTRPAPIWVARRMRWASPPDRVPAARARFRYPTPTSTRNLRRAQISATARSAMKASVSVSSTCSRKYRASSMDSSVTSWMDLPPTVTARISGRSRAPLHEPQALGDMYCSMRSRTRLEPLLA